MQVEVGTAASLRPGQDGRVNSAVAGSKKVKGGSDPETPMSEGVRYRRATIRLIRWGKDLAAARHRPCGVSA